MKFHLRTLLIANSIIRLISSFHTPSSSNCALLRQQSSVKRFSFSVLHDVSLPTVTTIHADRPENFSVNVSVDVGTIRDSSPLPRVWEIGFILARGILAPLLMSLAANSIPWQDNGGTETAIDDFWACQDVETGISNADRVVAALQAMGCTYVKFGQALASRPDVIASETLAKALSRLQDQMDPFDSKVAKAIIRSELQKCNRFSAAELNSIMDSLPEQPVAAASIGQVYKALLPGYGFVAIKVQRPGIIETVRRDEIMLRSIAKWIESLPSPFIAAGTEERAKLVASHLVEAVDEFMSRMYEELDYRNEAANLQEFARLYSIKNGNSPTVKVVVPELLPDLCTDMVLVMEWIDGSKLTNLGSDPDGSERAENLKLVEMGIECTLSQLLDTGILHADPHASNLLKVTTANGDVQLGYLDFGILSTIPESVRDGLVCAVVQLIFAQNVEKVASLFGELKLLPHRVLENPARRKALVEDLDTTFRQVLQYPEQKAASPARTTVPTMRFDKLLLSLSFLVMRYEFTLPPYFLNNARALGTLEGIARQMDPDFNILRVVYPYALSRLLSNPSNSPIVEGTMMDVLRSPKTKRVDLKRLQKVLQDSAAVTGFSKRKVIRDILKSRGGRHLVRKIFLELARSMFAEQPKLLPMGAASERIYFRL